MSEPTTAGTDSQREALDAALEAANIYSAGDLALALSRAEHTARQQDGSALLALQAVLNQQEDSGDPNQRCPVCLLIIDSLDHEESACVIVVALTATPPSAPPGPEDVR